MSYPALEHGHRDLAALFRAMQGLEQYFTARLSAETPDDASVVPRVVSVEEGSLLHRYFSAQHFSAAEQLIVLLALAPEIDPDLLDRVFAVGETAGRTVASLGGIRGKQYRGLLPTGETAMYLIGGKDTLTRLAVRHLLTGNSPLRRRRVVRLKEPADGEPSMSGQLVAEPDFVDRLLTGRVPHPTFSPSFPAQLLESELTWADLILPEASLTEITHLRHYLEYYRQIGHDPAYGRHSRRGYRALFYGPPGTGKTLTATLLGKAVGKPVFRVDLSMVVSKWIGETEKNLAGLFANAESKGWILFFDEADALFSKRGEVKDSRDKYANQETSYLLQRIENYDGLCILATNFRNNLDKAFLRRFEAVVPFHSPTPDDRERLWQNMLPASHPLAAGVHTGELARRYDLSGAHIANAIRHAVYAAVAAGSEVLSAELLASAIRREYEKEDRLFPGA